MGLALGRHHARGQAVKADLDHLVYQCSVGSKCAMVWLDKGMYSVKLERDLKMMPDAFLTSDKETAIDLAQALLLKEPVI